MANPNQITLTVVVNGQPIPMTENIHEPLHVLIQHALQQSGNSGQPKENWELRDAGGNVLDPSQKIEGFHFPPGATLFLNLKAGVGG